ncbi:GNAT family N-acetyltransferase [Mycobacterium sp. Marseille-P9652]|uniref:GNAT family N-acetyltransferase n=1 Tax=Mycobacterium sp. Marseille-P9652 TaxID=2654950 RepID=UPI0012E7B80A|nr:GNAT family N-acetyltransferase [Mycobacterium sp. Marseille-P9652]
MNGRIEVTAVRRFDELAAIRKEWAGLHEDAAPGSPFEHPAWAETWAKYYVPEADLECVAVRDHAQSDSLIGFAPLYRRHRGVAGVGATCLQPLGTGRHQALTEVVQVLARPERTSDVMRAVLHHLESLEGWNWAHLSLGPTQGWLVPQWLDDHANAMLRHIKTRPCVVFDDLPTDVAGLKSRLKRNVRESIRRSRNRSAKLGSMTFRSASDVAELDATVPKLVELHRMRAAMPGKVEHADILGGMESAFLADTVQHFAEYGLARIYVAEHASEPVAAQLVLSDGRTDYVSVSGLDPRYWDFSLNTMLIYNALEDAVSLRRTALNLSTGPGVAKNRWSSTITTYHDFAIVRPDRRSRWLYGGFTHASLALDHYHEARLHRTRDDTKLTRRVREASRRAADVVRTRGVA